jgi:hypothetical protein
VNSEVEDVDVGLKTKPPDSGALESEEVEGGGSLKPLVDVAVDDGGTGMENVFGGASAGAAFEVAFEVEPFLESNSF